MGMIEFAMIKLFAKYRLIVCGLALMSFQVTGPVCAGSLSVEVVDHKGKALENALVFLAPQFALASPAPVRDDAEMRQQNILFSPFVLPVQVGTEVSFPNFDESRHHVYSFSKSKRFELRLYGKDESNSLVFDVPGVVAIGCNIHDNMLAYIYVTEAPLFAKTGADGLVKFSGLEQGQYELTAWHPGVRKKGAPEPQMITVGIDDVQTEAVIRVKRFWREQSEPEESPY